jgi:hypothetical protein
MQWYDYWGHVDMVDDRALTRSACEARRPLPFVGWLLIGCGSSGAPSAQVDDVPIAEPFRIAGTELVRIAEGR